MAFGAGVALGDTDAVGETEAVGAGVAVGETDGAGDVDATSADEGSSIGEPLAAGLGEAEAEEATAGDVVGCAGEARQAETLAATRLASSRATTVFAGRPSSCSMTPVLSKPMTFPSRLSVRRIAHSYNEQTLKQSSC